MSRFSVPRWLIPVILIAALAAWCRAADKDDKKEEKPKPAQSIPELQQQLEKILKDTHTPGVSVAIVHRDGPEWVAGLGIADVASARPTTADTLFRIGSTSKAFASLSILMLADQGKLSLDDPVHKLAPDVWFENKWEATDPIRVVNLLEHTTGWDDIHLREYAKDAPGMTLREGLDYDHHSRISRWRPGTLCHLAEGPVGRGDRRTIGTYDDERVAVLFDGHGGESAGRDSLADTVLARVLGKGIELEEGSETLIGRARGPLP